LYYFQKKFKIKKKTKKKTFLVGFFRWGFWVLWVGFLLPTLLIDNEDFATLPPRRGSHVDSACLTRLFQQLGFWVVLRRNLGRVSLEFELVSFATDTMHHSLDMAIGKRAPTH
jgi:hypothetical protein